MNIEMREHKGDVKYAHAARERLENEKGNKRGDVY